MSNIAGIKGDIIIDRTLNTVIAAGLLIGGFIFLAGGALLIAVPARRASAR